MPVQFTDERLSRYAEMVGLSRLPDESQGKFRDRVADFVDERDPVEAHEIRTGKGWNQWDDIEFALLIDKHPELVGRNPMVTMRALRK